MFIFVLIIVVLIIYKSLILPKVYFNVGVDELTNFIFALYFRGRVQHDWRKSSHLLLINTRCERDMAVFIKFKERGIYGISLILYVDDKDLEIEKYLQEKNIGYHYENYSESEQVFPLILNFKADIPTIVPVIKDLNSKFRLFNEKMVFDISLRAVSKKITRYNEDDDEMLNQVKDKIWFPITLGSHLIIRLKKKLRK